MHFRMYGKCDKYTLIIAHVWDIIMWVNFHLLIEGSYILEFSSRLECSMGTLYVTRLSRGCLIMQSIFAGYIRWDRNEFLCLKGYFRSIIRPHILLHNSLPKMFSLEDTFSFCAWINIWFLFNPSMVLLRERKKMKFWDNVHFLIMCI